MRGKKARAIRKDMKTAGKDWKVFRAMYRFMKKVYGGKYGLV
jgi:hypothetical protein